MADVRVLAASRAFVAIVATARPLVVVVADSDTTATLALVAAVRTVFALVHGSFTFLGALVLHMWVLAAEGAAVAWLAAAGPFRVVVSDLNAASAIGVAAMLPRVALVHWRRRRGRGIGYLFASVTSVGVLAPFDTHIAGGDVARASPSVKRVGKLDALATGTGVAAMGVIIALVHGRRVRGRRRSRKGTDVALVREFTASRALVAEASVAPAGPLVVKLSDLYAHTARGLVAAVGAVVALVDRGRRRGGGLGNGGASVALERKSAARDALVVLASTEFARARIGSMVDARLDANILEVLVAIV